MSSTTFGEGNEAHGSGQPHQCHCEQFCIRHQVPAARSINLCLYQPRSSAYASAYVYGGRLILERETSLIKLIKVLRRSHIKRKAYVAFSLTMDPQGPAQPSLDTVYSIAGNPVDQSAQESREASLKADQNSGKLVEAREQGDVPIPSSHGSGPTASSLGYGARDSSGDKGGAVRCDFSTSSYPSISVELSALFLPTPKV